MRSLVVILSLILLNSCASTSTKNLPFNFDFEALRIEVVLI
jgi:hypothetical protein